MPARLQTCVRKVFVSVLELRFVMTRTSVPMTLVTRLRGASSSPTLSHAMTVMHAPVTTPANLENAQVR